MENKHLLVIEDEAEIRDLIEIVLKRQGYRVTALSSVEEFKSLAQGGWTLPYDLLVLDWMLPGQSGCDFLKDLRRNPEWKHLPVLMVTAKAEPEEIILGLERGADDYLIKPFDSGVLVARVKALLRRGRVQEKSQQIQWKGLLVNLESFEASYGGQKLPLTPTEFRLLAVMAQHHGKAFTREQLVQAVQGEGVNVIGRTVDTHVFSLRKKLGPLGESIETARGVGYRFREPEGIQ